MKKPWQAANTQRLKILPFEKVGMSGLKVDYDYVPNAGGKRRQKQVLIQFA